MRRNKHSAFGARHTLGTRRNAFVNAFVNAFERGD
jgi:hypothetical protein